MASKPQGGWQFVNISEPKKQKKDETIRRIVRANAMRDFRKKQKKERQASAQIRATPTVNEGRPVKRSCDIHKPSTPPESVVVSEYPAPGFLGDERWRDEAYNLWPAELRKLLGSLESMSLSDLTIKNEEELATQVQQQTFDLSTDFDWLPDGEMAFSRDLAGQGFTTNPRTLLDFGADPFNALPAFGSPRYNAFVIHHFASVTAQNCLPVDPGAGENPLTKIWLPYAMQDPALFLSTLSFAAVHIDILAGRKANPKLLLHKNDTIRTINEKIQSPEEALSDSTIGAVAMVAATESIQGNYKELSIHMNALTRMVRLRGGLQKLGWSGVLHMFISWQDLLYSSILAQPPAYQMTPCCLLIRGNLAPDSPVYSALGLDPGVSEQFGSLFAELRYLTDNLNQHNIGSRHRQATTLDIMTFSKMRTAVEHRILGMASSSQQKSRATMTHDDYTLELCRLAALIYIKCGLHMFLPVCSILVSLKEQVMQLMTDGEKHDAIGLSGKIQPSCATWGMVMGSLLAVTPEEEVFFAKRIAKGTRDVGGRGWSDIETLLKHIAWVDKLRTPVCRSVWARVEAINAEEFQRLGMVDQSRQWLGGNFSTQVFAYP